MSEQHDGRVLTVLEVTTRGLPWMGGVETHVHNLSAAMVRRGTDVQVFTHTTPRGAAGMPGPLDRVDGVTYRRFRLPLSGNWSLPSLGLLRQLRRAARDADIVHLHLYHQPLAACAVLALTGVKVPVVVTPHYHGTGHSVLASLVHRVWRPTVGRLLMSRADAVIAVSAPEADLLVRHFPFLDGRVQVIPNGIVAPAPTVAVPDEVPADATVLLSVGRLEAYKRNDAVIAALPQLPRSVKFVVAGDGPDRERLAQLARDLGIEDRVLLLGRVTDEALASWWGRADLFVTLSSQEAFGLTLGEALAAGVPVLASDIPAFRYVASLSTDAGAPADAVRFVSGDRVAAAVLAARGRFAPVLVASWQGVADTSLALFCQLGERTSDG